MVLFSSEDEAYYNDTRARLASILNEPKIQYKREIVKQPSLKDAHIYCMINRMSAIKYGCLLEFYIRKQFDMKKNLISTCNGDVHTIQNLNLEIKISMSRHQFNYVQLRLNHQCDYLFTAYHLNQETLDDLGELFIFKLSKKQLKELIQKFGSYAHGTRSKLGNITAESLESLDNREYALRPKYGDECWKSLLTFRIQERDIQTY